MSQVKAELCAVLLGTFMANRLFYAKLKGSGVAVCRNLLADMRGAADVFFNQINIWHHKGGKSIKRCAYLITFINVTRLSFREDWYLWVCTQRTFFFLGIIKFITHLFTFLLLNAQFMQYGQCATSGTTGLVVDLVDHFQCILLCVWHFGSAPVVVSNMFWALLLWKGPRWEDGHPRESPRSADSKTFACWRN